MFQTPPPYYDRFSPNPRAKGWLRLLANPGKTIQSAELIEMQTVHEYQFEQGMRHLFAEGQFVEGGDITITPHTTGGYHTGTVAVSGTTVTGTGTTFQTSGVVSGQVIGFGSTNPADITAWFTISTVNSETSLTLVQNAGSLSPGAVFTVGTGSGFDVAIGDGQIYASGRFHFVPSGDVVITGVGAEVIGILITRVVITSIQDTSLLDPAVGAEDFLFSGMDRLTLAYQYAVNNPAAVPIATFIDGQLVVNPAPSGFLGQIIDLMALRTFEQSGNFVTTPPILSLADQIVDNPTHLILTIDHGTGYPRGYRVANSNKSFITIDRTTDGTTDLAEPHTYLTGTYGYILNNPAVLGISRVQATLQSPTISMTRGNVVNGQDGIPAQYANVRSVVHNFQAIIHPSDYTLGTDYTVVGSYIQWLPGGAQPATGSSYSLQVAYDKVLTKAVRTQTEVINEAHTVAGPTTLTHHDHGIQSIVSIIDTDTSAVLEEGTDFTIVLKTGVITWIASPTHVHVTYYYWAATVEGDFLSRDSFVDTAGSPLLYLTPDFSPNVISPNIDFKTQIVFDTTSGNTPMNSTIFDVDYSYALARIDVLAWAKTGIFSIFKGKPGISPQAIIVSDDFVPVAKLHLPPDCMADDVVEEYYNNRTMLVTDLRSMFNQLATVQYNLAQFQLASDTINIPTPTDKRGVFADPLTDPHLADISNTLFGGTFDFFGQLFELPRVQSTQSIGVGTLKITPNGAVLNQDTWLTQYTENIAVQQTFQSELTAINSFQFVNDQAVISCSPPASIDVAQANTITITSSNNSQTAIPSQQIAASALLSQVVPGSWAADQSGSGSTQVNQLLNSITPDAEWVNAAQTSSGQASGLVSTNKWATIQATTTLVESSVTVATGPVITLTGSNFLPNERAICALLNGQPLALTGFGGTTNDATYTGAVVADSTGAFKALFQVPAGTVDGTYILQVVGRNQSNLNTIQSVSSTIFTVGSFVQETATNVNFTRKVTGSVNSQIRAVYAYAEALGIGDHVGSANSGFSGYAIFEIDTSGNAYYVTVGAPTSSPPTSFNGISVVGAIPGGSGAGAVWLGNANITSNTTTSSYPFNPAFAQTGYSSTATTIAYGIMYANKKGITVTKELLIGALGAMFAYQNTYSVPPAEQIVAIASSVTPTSTNVKQLVSQMESLGYWYLGVPLLSKSSVIDPLAQTFSLPQDGYITSLDLWFGHIPNAQVMVAIAEVVNNQPTDNYLVFAYKQPSGIINTGSTNFKFEKSVRLSANTDYCFVVMTTDPLATIEIARLGGVDQNGNLISANPYSGSMFKSANAKSWQLDPTAQVRFNVNVAEFAQAQSILNFGVVTLPQASSVISFFMPFANPSQDCSVIYQYSLDGARWFDFQPTKEVELGGAFTTINLRILINGTDMLCPQVLNAAMLQSSVYTTSSGLTTSGPNWTFGGGDGAYVHRMIDLGEASSSEQDVYVDVDLPGNTAIQPAITFDDATWFKMTEVVSDRVPLSDQYTERHYVFNTAVNTIQTVVAGTAATGESLEITATGSTIEGGQASAISPVTTGQTAIQCATALVSVVNNHPLFIAAGITADNTGGTSATIVLTWSSSSAITFTTAVIGGSSDTITSPSGGSTSTPIYKQNVRMKIGMASTISYATPRIRNPRLIAR